MNLDQADKLVRDLFDEWSLVSQAYTDDPHGSDVGYTLLMKLNELNFVKN